MLRMSFMEHLEELHTPYYQGALRPGQVLVGSLIYAGQPVDIISDPAVEALKHLKVEPPQLAQLTPMCFSIIWVKLPLLCSVFIASPWIVWQVWSFISPGLYKKERRWAMPCAPHSRIASSPVVCLPISWLPFRPRVFARHRHEQQRAWPVVSITEYFDLFVNVTLA